MHHHNFSYRTIESPSQGHYRDKGSRFLSFAYPITAESDAREHLAALKKTFHDARHHCFAWILGADERVWRAFDDGEPGHSAGDPILGQIRSRDLTNVLVVVVRYFGGVKLGVRGLITAYKTAADDALTHAVIIEREVTDRITIVYDYACTADIMRLVKECDLVIISQKFETECELHAEYKMSDKQGLLEKLALIKAIGGKISYRQGT